MWSLKETAADRLQTLMSTCPGHSAKSRNCASISFLSFPPVLVNQSICAPCWTFWGLIFCTPPFKVEADCVATFLSWCLKLLKWKNTFWLTLTKCVHDLLSFIKSEKLNLSLRGATNRFYKLWTPLISEKTSNCFLNCFKLSLHLMWESLCPLLKWVFIANKHNDNYLWIIFLFVIDFGFCFVFRLHLCPQFQWTLSTFWW